jgi:alkylation response protein AidB-like acyl-CoA dehydrogenase
MLARTIPDRSMSILAPAIGPDTVVNRVRSLVPWIQQRADQLDAAGLFPTDEIAALRDAGALRLPLPIETAGHANERADRLGGVLTNIGRANLAIGRVVEAHVNARHLIARYGSSAQRARAADDVANGHLFALWVTDQPANALRMTTVCDRIRLEGGKMFCSAAGHATRVLVTAMDDNGDNLMVVLPLGVGECVTSLESQLQGVRAAVTGAVDFSGCTIGSDALLGGAGDYLREPDFSAGAWRGSAVAFGGLRSLIDLAKTQLEESCRVDNPHQLHRLGVAMIACESSRLWVREAARIAENPLVDPGYAVAYVGLGRIAVESACLDAMRLVQRSLGLSAFRSGNPVERICRDLATYLRQPAPDQVLTEAAVYFAQQPMLE